MIVWLCPLILACIYAAIRCRQAAKQAHRADAASWPDLIDDFVAAIRKRRSNAPVEYQG